MSKSQSVGDNEQAIPMQERIDKQRADLHECLDSGHALEIVSASCKSAKVLTLGDNAAEFAKHCLVSAKQYLTRENFRSDEYLAIRPDNYLSAVCKLASWGLYLDSRGGSGFITMRRDRKQGGSLVCVPIPGIRGYERLAVEALKLDNRSLSMHSGVIREQDTYTIESGSCPTLHHTPNLLPDPSATNRIIASYCVARTRMDEPYPHFAIKPIMESEVMSNRMDMETACRYMAQRKALREVIRMIPGGEQFRQIVEEEDASYRETEEHDTKEGESQNNTPIKKTAPSLSVSADENANNQDTEESSTKSVRPLVKPPVRKEDDADLERMLDDGEEAEPEQRQQDSNNPVEKAAQRGVKVGRISTGAIGPRKPLRVLHRPKQ